MDSAFHCKMADFSGNDYLYNFVKTLDLKVQLIRNIVPLDLDEIREGSSVHTDIAELGGASDILVTELNPFRKRLLNESGFAVLDPTETDILVEIREAHRRWTCR